MVTSKAAKSTAPQLLAGFDLPYYDEYGYSDDTALSSILDDPDEHVSRDTEEDDEGCAVELHTYGDGYISKLYDLLGEMESQVRDWNTSNC